MSNLKLENNLTFSFLVEWFHCMNVEHLTLEDQMIFNFIEKRYKSKKDDFHKILLIAYRDLDVDERPLSFTYKYKETIIDSISLAKSYIA